MTLIQYKDDTTNDIFLYQFRLTDFEFLFKWNDRLNRLEVITYYVRNKYTTIKDVKDEIHNTV